MTLHSFLSILMWAAVAVFIWAAAVELWALAVEAWENRRRAVIERQMREAAENRHL